jgi:hypothetical protein
MAAGVLVLIPACIFFAFIRRYLVQGLTASALRLVEPRTTRSINVPRVVVFAALSR